MIPGFVTAYIDKNNYRHLYFFPGIGDDNNKIYNDIDLSSYTGKYDTNINEDDSIDYKFYDKHISRIICNLNTKDNKITKIVLNY